MLVVEWWGGGIEGPERSWRDSERSEETVVGERALGIMR